MNDSRRFNCIYQFKHLLSIADIQFMMLKIPERINDNEPLLAPACISVMAEKNRTLIVVYTVNEIPFSMEESHNL
jgi:hypothetical protein